MSAPGYEPMEDDEDEEDDLNEQLLLDRNEQGCDRALRQARREIASVKGFDLPPQAYLLWESAVVKLAMNCRICGLWTRAVKLPHVTVTSGASVLSRFNSCKATVVSGLEAHEKQCRGTQARTKRVRTADNLPIVPSDEGEGGEAGRRLSFTGAGLSGVQPTAMEAGPSGVQPATAMEAGPLGVQPTAMEAEDIGDLAATSAAAAFGDVSAMSEATQQILAEFYAEVGDATAEELLADDINEAWIYEVLAEARAARLARASAAAAAAAAAASHGKRPSLP